MCAPWVKYWLLMILFILSFMCLYTPGIDIYGFGSFFVLQTILAMFVFIDLTQDESGALKVLQMGSVGIPFAWFLAWGAVVEFVAAFFMILSLNFVYKKFYSLQMSSENHWRLDFVKHTFVAVTVLVFILAMFYWNYNANFSGTSKMIILAIMVGIAGLSTADLIYANRFLQLINTTTDG